MMSRKRKNIIKLAKAVGYVVKKMQSQRDRKNDRTLPILTVPLLFRLKQRFLRIIGILPTGKAVGAKILIILIKSRIFTDKAGRNMSGCPVETVTSGGSKSIKDKKSPGLTAIIKKIYNGFGVVTFLKRKMSRSTNANKGLTSDKNQGHAHFEKEKK